MTIRLDSAIGFADWERAMQQANFTPLQQDWGYGAAAEDFGAKLSRIGIYHHDRLIGLAQLTHKKVRRIWPLSLCMRGPIWLGAPDTPTKSAAYRALRRHRFYSLWMPEEDDHAALHAAGGRRVMSSYHTVILDLTQPIESLRAQLDGKWRNRLVASENASLRIARLTSPADYRFILEAEAEQSQRKHYAALSPMLVSLYQLQRGDKAVYAISAQANSNDIAAIICLLHGRSATYHIGWSNEDGKRLSAHNLLLWHAIKELKARGICWLDLGGIMTEAEGAGIARFKIGAGGRVMSLSGTYF